MNIKRIPKYIKILNYMVKEKEREDEFFRIFEPISDMVTVENLVELNEELDYREIAGEGVTFDHTVSNTKLVKTHICSMPFYTLQINADGTVAPCCIIDVPPSIGDVKQESLKNIWTNQAYAFQKHLLNGVENVVGCADCKFMKYEAYPEDVLDVAVDEIKKRYEK